MPSPAEARAGIVSRQAVQKTASSFFPSRPRRCSPPAPAQRCGTSALQRTPLGKVGGDMAQLPRGCGGLLSQPGKTGSAWKPAHFSPTLTLVWLLLITNFAILDTSYRINEKSCFDRGHCENLIEYNALC